MAKTKKTQGKLARYVNTPEAMEKFRRHYGVPDDVYLEYRFWEDAIPGTRGSYYPKAKGGVRFPNPGLPRLLPNKSHPNSPNIFRMNGRELDFPGHGVPPKTGNQVEEKKKHIQAHLTDPVALQAVYDSEVCVDEYANPRAYKLLRCLRPGLAGVTSSTEMRTWRWWGPSERDPIRRGAGPILDTSLGTQGMRVRADGTVLRTSPGQPPLLSVRWLACLFTCGGSHSLRPFKTEAERMRREVDLQGQVRIATLKKDEADLKLEDRRIFFARHWRRTYGRGEDLGFGGGDRS
uniref:Uncharacterized protein n=1 Tax=Fagus sylvatica TaxID=28930 RepID=A0A2N9G7M9_FAGSY